MHACMHSWVKKKIIDFCVIPISQVSDQLGLLKHCKKGNSSDCLSILKQKVKLNINLCDKVCYYIKVV